MPSFFSLRHSIVGLLLLLTLSTARSFQPEHNKNNNNNHLQQQQNRPQQHPKPLYVSSTSTTASPSSLSSDLDWSHHKLVVPASTTASTKRRRDNVYTAASSTSTIDTDIDTTTDYQRAKEEWANRYTNLGSLRETFGKNRNVVWGDLDAATARRLYKTLLPKALLELVQVGGDAQELAPLAYQARVAAKLYARERCQVPARVAACMYDGFRQWKKYGKFQTCGMSYDQIWLKYQKLILEETSSVGDLTEEDYTAKICLKILEKSCVTNERIDQWVLPPDTPEQRHDLQQIAQTLEHDVRKLLNNNKSIIHENDEDAAKEEKPSLSLRKYRTLRLVARARRRGRQRQAKRQLDSKEDDDDEDEDLQ